MDPATPYRAIFDMANDAIFLHDLGTGAILDVNQKMTEMYGCSREEARQLSVADLSAGDEPYTQERALGHLRLAAAGTPQLFEWLAKDRRGRRFWVEVNLKHVVIDGDHRMLAIVRDITDRKQVEESLRAADERLREQASLVRLGEMAAVVAHEVKNPLAGIRGAIQIISSRLPPASKDAAIMGEVIARIDALNEMMKELLLFARPPRLQLTPVDIVALARQTTELIAGDSAMASVRFDIEGMAPTLRADPELLRVVLVNVVLNAAQAVRCDGAVRISIAGDDQVCRIAIADTGPGIPSSIRDRIFVPFFTTKSRGTGLGLPTAKRFVDAHHGRINVDCPPGAGTIVTIELPCAALRLRDVYAHGLSPPAE
jgi:PAS domain S-box-containing protein